jgi:hypothetical protein
MVPSVASEKIPSDTTKFCRPDDMAPGICATVQYAVFYKMVCNKTKHVNRIIATEMKFLIRIVGKTRRDK